MNYYIFNDLGLVQCFDRFNKEQIKQAIISYLDTNPCDLIELCKDFNKSDLRRYAGYETLSFYQKNTSGLACKVVAKGNKEYLKPI